MGHMYILAMSRQNWLWERTTVFISHGDGLHSICFMYIGKIRDSRKKKLHIFIFLKLHHGLLPRFHANVCVIHFNCCYNDLYCCGSTSNILHTNNTISRSCLNIFMPIVQIFMFRLVIIMLYHLNPFSFSKGKNERDQC